MDFNAIVNNFRDVVTKQYFAFDGRTARREFWYYVLAYVVIYIVVSFIEGIFWGGAAYVPHYGYYYYFNPRPLTGLLTLALLLPSLGIAARRLHDIDRSAWWLLIGLIPVIGWLVLLYWYVQPGTTGTNQFGEIPSAEPPAAA